MPTGDESLYELEAGCADRRCTCRQDVRAFSLLMNFRLGVPTEDEFAGWRCL